MNKPATRFDFSIVDAVTPGEHWRIRVPVRVKTGPNTYVNISSYAGISAIEWYLFMNLRDNRDSEPLFMVSMAEDEIETDVLPYYLINVVPEKTELAVEGSRGYEMWATVNGQSKRIAHGTIQVIR